MRRAGWGDGVRILTVDCRNLSKKAAACYQITLYRRSVPTMSENNTTDEGRRRARP